MVNQRRKMRRKILWLPFSRSSNHLRPSMHACSLFWQTLRPICWTLIRPPYMAIKPIRWFKLSRQARLFWQISSCSCRSATSGTRNQREWSANKSSILRMSLMSMGGGGVGGDRRGQQSGSSESGIVVSEIVEMTKALELFV